MALPSSGTLNAQSINFELGRSRSATLSIDTAENGGYGAINTSSPSRPNAANPAAYSEWYGYNHTAGGGGGNELALGYNLTNGNFACTNYLFGGIGLYWADSPTLESATLLYADISLTTFANPGWYSNGATNRRWVSGRTNAFTQTEPCTL
jgi:hypothetical protein